MASCRVVCRLSVRIPSDAVKQTAVKSSLPNFNQSKLASSSLNRISGFSRSPVELSCGLLSMMPLHSTIASARYIYAFMRACMSWGMMLQLMPFGFCNGSGAAICILMLRP